MQLEVVESYEDLSRLGANLVSAVITANPAASLIVPTGETPLGMYAELASRVARGEIDPTHLRIFQLDDYLGLTPDDRRSLYGWMRRSFLEPLGIAESQVVRLPSDTPDPEAACRRYNEAVREAGGIDLSVLGLGPNGHLGFNEPPVDQHSPTRIVELAEESVRSNARYWGGQETVPRRALTAGMDILLAARQTLLLVSGTGKADILQRALDEEPTPDVPASYLQRAANVTVIADRDAWPSSRESG